MLEIRMTRLFRDWLHDLRDGQARARVQARLRRIADGNPGQIRALKGDIREMKIDHGPGYRVYYTQRENVLVILLCGGNKQTQQQDIETAMRLAKEL